MSDELANCPVCYSWSGSTCVFCGHERGYKYSVVLADPPYLFENQGNRAAPAYEGEQREEKRYEVMSLQDLKLMPQLDEIVAEDAFLFLWSPHALVLDGQAQELARAWRFTPKQEIIWAKTNLAGDKLVPGLGNYGRVVSEPMLLCKRGSPRVARHDLLTMFFAPRTKHSTKPDESYVWIQALTGADRFLELFARRRYSAKWVCHGNQAPRYEQVAEG